MGKLLCYDANGEAMKSVFQWDTNREIRFGGFTLSGDKSYRVQFGSRCFGRTVDYEPELIIGSLDGAVMKSVIPIQFLEYPAPIEIYIYQIDDETGEAQTIASATVPVVPRAMPSDYASAYTVLRTPNPNGLLYDDGELFLTMDGVKFGRGIILDEGDEA